MASVSSPQRLLITGIEGFTGQYLAREMQARGYEVYGTAYNFEDPANRISSLDLCNPEAVQKTIQTIKPDLVAHLAAIAFVADRNVAGIYQTNILGTYNLLEALGNMESHKPRSILLASSAAIYGNNAVGEVSEDVTPDPTSDYAVSKYAMENMAKLWMDRLPIVVVRPFNYTGVGQPSKYLIPKIVQAFAERHPYIELGNIDISRDFGDVRNVVNIYGRLLEKNPAGQFINISTGVVHSLKDVISMCENITGHKIEIRVNKEFIRPNEVKVLVGNNMLLKSIIGEVTSSGLQETLTWMLSECGKSQQ